MLRDAGDGRLWPKLEGSLTWLAFVSSVGSIRFLDAIFVISTPDGGGGRRRELRVHLNQMCIAENSL